MIDDYLNQLRVGLRTSAAERDRILAEAEDHLRQSVEAGLAAGLTGIEAQEAAISAFGSISAVVRAHARHRPPREVAADLVLATWKLGAITLTGVGASGLVAAYFNHVNGPSFVGGAPAGTRYSAARCQYWQSAWHVGTCARAAMLEVSSDAVSLRVLAGVAGLAALGGYLVARRVLRRRGLFAGRLFPALGTGFFGLASVVLVLLAQRHISLPFLVPAGPGAYLSGAIVTGALTAGYLAVAWRRSARGRRVCCLPSLYSYMV